MATAINSAQLKSDLNGILAETAASLGVTLSDTAPAYLSQLSRVAAAYLGAKTAGNTAVANELALTLDAMAKDVASITADQVSTEFNRFWQRLVSVLVKAAVAAIAAA